MTEKTAMFQVLGRRGAHVLEQILDDAETKVRADAVARLEGLKKDLANANAERARRETELEQKLVPLRAAMDRAYEVWLAACAALEAQRAANVGESFAMQARIDALTTALRGPMLHEMDDFKQWSTPDWAQGKPPEVPPMPRSP